MLHFRMSFTISIYLIVLLSAANPIYPSDNGKISAAYSRYGAISDEAWEAVKPYLLPENHRLKAKLDKIFMGSRALLNAQTLHAAGFRNVTPNKYSRCIVTTHSKLKGYVVKLFLDSQVGLCDWKHFAARAYGASCIKEAIPRLGYQAIFKVPEKWIYMIPEHPAPPPGLERKNFILIAEDMRILPNDLNRSLWRSNRMDQKRLRAYYTIIKDQGLSDSVICFNVPFCEDGKNAFVDTEYNHCYPIDYIRVFRYLGPQGQALWRDILANDGH